MPPQRSARHSARSANTAPAQSVSRPKRGKRGYRLFRDGFLNATPMGTEIAITKKNAQDSPLLRLPPEIRDTIWNYTFAGHVYDFELRRSMYETFVDRHSLLRVCRQIYAEAALLPRKLVTANFHSFKNFVKAADAGELRFVRSIRTNTLLRCLVDCFDDLVPQSVFRKFQSFHITLISEKNEGDSTRLKIEKDLRDCLHGKEVIVLQEID